MNGIVKPVQAILHSRLLLACKRDSNSHYWVNLQSQNLTVPTSKILKVEDGMQYQKTSKAPTSTTNKQEKEQISRDFAWDSIHSTSRWQLLKWSLLQSQCYSSSILWREQEKRNRYKINSYRMGMVIKSASPLLVTTEERQWLFQNQIEKKKKDKKRDKTFKL